MAQHDYVVVPNLGGFMVQMQSARILSDRITPPHATVGFNTLMNHADGLLAIEISRTEQISYRKAVEYIDNKVENLKIRLESNGSIIIGNLGILQKDNQGSLTFNPIYKSSFLPQNLGLSDLYVTTKKAQVIKENRTVVLTMPSSKSIKYAAAAMLAFGLFFVSPRVSDMRQADYANLASVSFVKSTKSIKKQAVKIEPADSVETASVIIPKTTSPKVISPTKVVTPNATATKDENNYHVIVASLPSQESAEKFCKELIKDHFAYAQVLPSSKMYRVAIQSFSDREKATDFIQSLRKVDGRFGAAWVFSK